ncbi:acyltransferase family protein [Synechococcus sp. RS9915]|nr:acyltransferase family protein [Synechococcus sp. RS9915]
MRIPRSNELDLLRLVLATSVVFQHSRLAITNTHMLWIERIPAVPLFILLSGLLVTESYLNSPTLRIYIQKRLRRILPAYIVVVLLGGLILWAIGAFLSLPGSGSFLQLASYYFNNLLFLNFLQPCVFDSSIFREVKYCAVNGSLWTIKFELFFYMILPFIIFSLGKLPKLICFFASLLLLVFAMFTPSIYFQIFVCFVAGVLFSLSRDFWLPSLVNIKIPSILRAFLVLFAAILIGGNFPLPVAAIVLLSLSFVGTKYASKDINFLKFGDLSYGIYLVHYPLIQIFVFLRIQLFIHDIFFAPLIIAFSGVLAMLLYRHVEKRFLVAGSHYNSQS